MRRIFLVGCMVFGMAPIMSYATWQVADASHGTNLSQPSDLSSRDYPKALQDQVSIQVQKGSLRDNVERAAQENNWEVIWHADDQYSVLTESTFSGPDFSTVMGQLLSHYHLKASFDDNNCVMTVSAIHKKESTRHARHRAFMHKIAKH